jgi:N-hydroxyarylamine O-acetyltransferase
VPALPDDLVRGLLRHIGIAEPPPPDAAGLRAVHGAFLSHVAYDALAVQLGECGPLEADTLAARVLAGGRGGYCFEINTVLYALLEALGFGIERRAAIIGERGARAAGAPTNHLALIVEAGGRRYLADAGWGEGPLDPLPLREGVHAGGPFAWSAEREPDGGWWIGQHHWGSTPGFWFADTPSPLEAFAPHHERLSTAPDSAFVKTLVVQRPFADRIVTLRSRTLVVDGPGLRERRVLPDAAAFAATLRDVFGIDPDVLGPERIARLWGQACAQHAAFVARRAVVS